MCKNIIPDPIKKTEYMIKIQNSLLAIILSSFILGCHAQTPATLSITVTQKDHSDLIDLFHKWRAFENPPKHDGAPDYRAATFTKRQPVFQSLQAQLGKIDTTNWTIADKVDYHILWAEMNGYDFNHRVLKPWQRDPAFYKCVWESRSDVPAHEGPTNHGTTELWTYNFPLSQTEKQRLLSDLSIIPSLNTQAQTNLTGNAKDLWITGIRDIKGQVSSLEELKASDKIQGDKEIIAAIDKAISSTNEFVSWLEKEAKSKNGPSGIGKQNYTWYLQNVHLVPVTWDDEVMILKRELARAWTALKLEEHRNRDLPKLIEATSPEEYAALAEKSAQSFMRFLEEDDIVTVKEYFEPALNEHLGRYVPKETRNFFYITMHYDPRPLYSHFYHWFELARMDIEPHKSEVRRGPLLYNIFDSRNEGMATAVEELFMQAGLYDDNPRVREMVYILIAQRAARGLGSLYAHANEMTMEEAGGIHSEYTPRGWMKTEKELLIFEQHLYLRQPGYGTSYITGKYLLENALAKYAKNQESAGKEFQIKNFLDHLNTMGNIPMSLGTWELTGDDEDILKIGENYHKL